MTFLQPLQAGERKNGRRRLLILALAMLVTAPFLAFRPAAAENPDYEILQRWQTGNRLLRPITYDDGMLYLAGDTTIEAWDVKQGRQLWQRTLELEADFRPRVTDDMVLANGRTYLIAMDRKTGETRWSLHPDKPLGTPYHHKGLIITGIGPLLTALDAKTGKVRWTMTTDQKKGIWYAPTGFGDDSILFGPGDGFLYALDADTGAVQWKINRAKEWQYLRQLHLSGPTLVAGGYKDNLFGLDAATGAAKWYWYSGNFINSHLVHEGAVYLWSPTGWVYSLDAHTGSRNWRTKSDYFPRKSKRRTPWAPVMAEIVANERGVYILDMKSVLHILDHGTGKETSSIQFPGKLRPFVALEPGSNRLFIGNNKGEILYVELN